MLDGHSRGPVSVIGVRGRGGPFERMSLSLPAGLTSLYGLNGVGKTWLLRMIRDCCEGTVKESSSDFRQLILQVPLTAPLGIRLMTAAADRLPEYDVGAISQDSSEDELRQALRSAVLYWYERLGQGPQLMRETFGSGNVDHLASSPLQMANEIVRSDSFALVPVGLREAVWEVWLCVPPNRPGFGFARSALSEAAAMAKSGRRIDVENAHLKENEDIDPKAGAVSWDLLPIPACSWTWRNLENSGLDVDSIIYNELWDFVDDGLPIPVAKICTLRGGAPFTFLDETVNVDIDALTAKALVAWFDLISGARQDADAAPEEMATVTVDKVVAHRLLKIWSDQVPAQVNDVYQSLLQDAPILSLEINWPREWLYGSGLAWMAGKHPLSALSQAQQRWANFAIRWTLADQADIVMIDEPEAALHRSAEEHMARGLAGLSIDQKKVVVATHSPMLLDDATTNVVEVYRKDTDSTAAARSLGRVERESLDRLGMQPSDLLRRLRVIVLVEGVHDEIVLNTVIGDVIAGYRAWILPLNGGRKLESSLDSQMLFEYTSAHLLAVLDNTRADYVSETWLEAQHRNITENHEDARDYLLERFPAKTSSENEFMRQWLIKALERGASGRIEPFGLQARDIIEYLPVQSLVPRAKHGWSELRAEHDALGKPLDKKKPDFKEWLKNNRGGRFEDETIRSAAESLKTSPPDDIFRLGYRIRELGSRPYAVIKSEPESS